MAVLAHLADTIPARELDGLIAKHVLRWRTVRGPDYDYNGPCDAHDVFLPPTVREQDTWFAYPPVGVIPPTYWCRDWSKHIRDAFEVVRHMLNEGFAMELVRDGERVGCRFSRGEPGAWAYAKTEPRAICYAALLACGFDPASYMADSDAGASAGSQV